jgi:poly(3-hydroxybutyrate) depolymerase
MFHVKRPLAAVSCFLALAAAAAGDPVAIPGDGVELNARLFRPSGDGPFPAVVMMHGCNGMWGPAMPGP